MTINDFPFIDPIIKVLIITSVLPNNQSPASKRHGPIAVQIDRMTLKYIAGFKYCAAL